MALTIVARRSNRYAARSVLLRLYTRMQFVPFHRELGRWWYLTNGQFFNEARTAPWTALSRPCVHAFHKPQYGHVSHDAHEIAKYWCGARADLPLLSLVRTNASAASKFCSMAQPPQHSRSCEPNDSFDAEIAMAYTCIPATPMPGALRSHAVFGRVAICQCCVACRGNHKKRS